MDTQMFEIRDYVLYFCGDQNKFFYNRDLIEIFKIDESETKSRTKIMPYQISHVLPSANANEMFIGQ